MSCQGRTHIAVELRERFGFHIIHTDTMYHPIGREGLKCQVGQESEEKNRLIREQRSLVTRTTIIEGSHIGNKQELDIFTRELAFLGDIYTFTVRSPNIQQQFISKHGVNSESEYEHISKWFKGIYNLDSAYVVSSVNEILNLIDEEDVYIPR